MTINWRHLMRLIALIWGVRLCIDGHSYAGSACLGLASPNILQHRSDDD